MRLIHGCATVFVAISVVVLGLLIFVTIRLSTSTSGDIGPANPWPLVFLAGLACVVGLVVMVLTNPTGLPSVETDEATRTGEAHHTAPSVEPEDSRR